MQNDLALGRPDVASEAAPKPGCADYGEALRSIYRQTVEEEIPEEFLDLLNQLD